MERAFLFWLGYMVTHTFELHGSRDVRLQAPTDPVPDLAPPYTAWGCKIEIHNSSSFFVSQCFIAEFTISHITKKNKLFLCTERICMPIRSICFLLGQLLFIPSYFYMTKTLKKEKLRADSFVRTASCAFFWYARLWHTFIRFCAWGCFIGSCLEKYHMILFMA